VLSSAGAQNHLDGLAMLSSVKEHPTPPSSPVLKPRQIPLQVFTPGASKEKHGFTTPKILGQSRRSPYDGSTSAPSLATHSLGMWTPGSSQAFGSPALDAPAWYMSYPGAPRKTSDHVGDLDARMPRTLPSLDMDAMAGALLPAEVESESKACNVPPRTPRQNSLDKPAAPISPPQSPKQVARHIATPRAPKKQQQPVLLKVLKLALRGVDNLDKVRALLALDPDAAVLPFFDYNMEPPLCCAARCECSAEVIELLIEHGACVEDLDFKGESPLDVLRSCRAFLGNGVDAAEAGQNFACPVEKALLEAGARPGVPMDGNLNELRFEGNADWGFLGMQGLVWPQVFPTPPAVQDQLETLLRASHVQAPREKSSSG